MKSIIFCFIGESGSGKTMVAEVIEKYAGIPMIRSYTDRPRRSPTESSHTFLEPSEFDLLDKNKMLAFTQWGQYRYACLEGDVKPVNTYVVDERGYKMLKEKYSDTYDIFSIRLVRDEVARVKDVGEERVMRDKGKFNISWRDFDRVIFNGNIKIETIIAVWDFISAKLFIRGMGQKINL